MIQELKEIHPFIKEVYRGPFWNKKRFYFGWSQNVHNFACHGFLIEADWFDTLPKPYKHTVLKREAAAAYMTSMRNVRLQ
jgi:hypothetical protein